MSIEMSAVAALAPTGAGAATGAAASAAAPVQVGYGVSLSDLGGFQQSLAGAAARLDAKPVSATSEAAKQLMKPFDHLNNEAIQISQDARAADAAGAGMTPGQMVNLTMRCQEFMFHCQLTSNIANRTSDGLQQLFRQQS
jgi:hypothetical protein